jgi:hypothetical protein
VAWNLSGEMIETCSCNMLCPCWFGQADLMLMDRGWCATSLLFRIRDGSFEGTSLAGLNAVVALHFPGPTLFDANGTGRVYVDDRASKEQRAALEAILQGQSGGGMQVPASLVSKWLPTKSAAISVSDSDGKIKASVGQAGEVASRRLVNDLGNKMTLQNSAFSLAFQFDGHVGELAPSDGTSWKDPDMPEVWEGRSGVAGQISWSG